MGMYRDRLVAIYRLWNTKHPVCLRHPPLYERGITRCQWSVVSCRCVLSKHSSM